MALHIHKVQPNTIITEYFIIVDISANKFTKKGKVTVAGYASKEARESAPLFPIVTKSFEITFDDVNGNLYAQAYEKLPSLKSMHGIAAVNETPYFDGATEA
jgi:hypothetical protein